MRTQIVMDHTGDTRHQFDPADADAVAEAKRRFQELTGVGFTAATRLSDGKSKVLKSFDPTAEETLFIPRLQGG
jgi:protein-disulfide isomerase-like protein with CxxC motif